MAIDISDNDIEIDEPSRLQPTATYNVKITTPETELLRAETERYRRALEFYANMDNYFSAGVVDGDYLDPLVIQDWGERARAALTPPDNGIAESANE